MTSTLSFQPIQRDSEADQSDSEEGTAICLTSSFGKAGGIQEYAVGRAVLAERLPDRAKAFTSPPIAQVDVYTAQKIQWSKLNNPLSEGKKKRYSQAALAAEALQGSSSPAARLAV